MKTFTMAFSIVLLLFACGCTSLSVTTPAELFAQKHPQEFASYKVLEPISATYIDSVSEEKVTWMSLVLHGIRKRVDHSAVELESYLAYLERLVECADLRNDEDWKHLKNQLRPKDQLYYFEYQKYGKSRDGLKRPPVFEDLGFLVLRGAKMVYRKNMMETQPSIETDKLKPPKGSNFNEL